MAIIAQAAARVRWPTQQSVPLGGSFNIYRSAAGGASVDFEAGPVNPRPLEAWPDDVAGGKVGFGAGPFGSGAFGAGHGGFGFGAGPFGAGDFGYGAHWLEYFTAELPDGTYKFAVVPLDVAGNENRAAALETSVQIAGRPAAAGRPTPTAYAGGNVTLEWTLSADDEG